MRPWRSLLYVPAHLPRFTGRAQERGADALILDLEDGVPADRKAEARAALGAAWDGLADGPSDIVVRINSGLRAVAADLEAAVRPGLAALSVTKVTAPDHLRHVADAVAELEAERGIAPVTVGLIALIETPAALEAAFDIAAAGPRVVALSLGGEDLATACGMAPTPDNLMGPRQRIVMAARAAGIAPLGLLDSVANLSAEGRLDLVRRSRAFGFSGATCVHPAAVADLNRGFLPDAGERAKARAVLDALAEAESSGEGAARLDGRMIDKPMRLRAEAVLALPDPDEA